DIPSIVPLLRGPSKRDRAIAVNKLCDLGEAAVPALNELLKSQDPDLRRIGVRALGGMGHAAKTAVPLLVKSLQDQDRQMRTATAIALGEMGAEAQAAVPALVAA